MQAWDFFLKIKSWHLWGSIRTNNLSQQWLHRPQRLYSFCAWPEFFISYIIYNLLQWFHKSVYAISVKLSFSLPRNSFADKYYWLFWPALISPKFNYATRSPQHCEPRSKAYLVLGNEDKILYSHTQYSIFEYIKIKLYCLHHKQTYWRSNNTIARSQLMHTLASTYLNIGLHLYPIFLEIAISGQWETWNKASCKNMFR